MDNITITLSQKDAENLLIVLGSAHQFLCGLDEYSTGRDINGIKPMMVTVWDVINQIEDSAVS